MLTATFWRDRTTCFKCHTQHARHVHAQCEHETRRTRSVAVSFQTCVCVAAPLPRPLVPPFSSRTLRLTCAVTYSQRTSFSVSSGPPTATTTTADHDVFFYTCIFSDEPLELYDGTSSLHGSDDLYTRSCGLLEEQRFINFAHFVAERDESRPDSLEVLDPGRHTMRPVHEKFGLAEDTPDLMGRAVALQPNADYLTQASDHGDATRKLCFHLCPYFSATWLRCSRTMIF